MTLRGAALRKLANAKLTLSCASGKIARPADSGEEIIEDGNDPRASPGKRSDNVCVC